MRPGHSLHAPSGGGHSRRYPTPSHGKINVGGPNRACVHDTNRPQSARIRGVRKILGVPNPLRLRGLGDLRYQNAPVGARSKHLCPPRSDRATIATPNDAPEGAEFIAPNRDDLHAVLGGFPGILGRRRNRIGGREARAIRKRQHCQVCRTTQSSPLCPPVVAPDPPNLKPSPDPVSPREADTSPSFR